MITAFILSACSPSGGQSVDLTEVPTLDISATHAIAIVQSANGLSFVPNNVAPWLGRIGLENADTSLSSADIDGRSAQKIPTLDHNDTFGLARENQSGVFLALSHENKSLDAFIESDDQGNFDLLSYSGNTLVPKAFCTTDQARQNSVSLLTDDGLIKTLSLTIATGENAKSAPVEQEIAASLPAPKNTELCSVTRNRTFAYSRAGNKARVHTYIDGKWTQTIVPTSIAGMIPLELNQQFFLLLLDADTVFIFNVQTQKFEYRLAVNSGLSIGGLGKTKFVTATTHHYGGAAFSEGLIAFGQADQDRIVFLSRSYLADIIKRSNS